MESRSVCLRPGCLIIVGLRAQSSTVANGHATNRRTMPLIAFQAAGENLQQLQPSRPKCSVPTFAMKKVVNLMRTLWRGPKNVKYYSGFHALRQATGTAACEARRCQFSKVLKHFQYADVLQQSS